MIRKYTFGSPLETDAVVEKKVCETGPIPYLNAVDERSFVYKLDRHTAVYGLGQQVRGINKRGWLYRSSNVDQPAHREDVHSLYASHNFIVVDGRETFGVFFDYPTTMEFDIGFTDKDEMRVTPRNWDLDVYVIEGEGIRDIVRQFRELVGRSYVPPRWAFGYSESRWSYMSEEEIRGVVKGHRDAGIPIDNIYLDIDYMDHYKDFSLNDETFPDFADFVKEMREEQIHLVPIIDAGVKIEPGDETYEEGVANDYFCRKADGSLFTGAVWPGHVHFPDVMNPAAREWFGTKYRFLIDQGIEGFWNDMNEPSIFFTPENFKKVIDTVYDIRNRELVQTEVDKLNATVANLSQNPEDFTKIYHNFNGEGTWICHDEVHNLFGYNMTRGASTAFEKMYPDKRLLLISRSSYIGMHRYGGIWQGDNNSWWSHLLLNIKMMPSLNMCGILYSGANIGGFQCETTEDLMIRWMEFGIFTPLFWNHACIDSPNQELYRFKSKETMRNMVEIRYGFMPYLYSEYMKAVIHNDMMFRPLAFDYPDDPMAREVEDQLMLGDGLMLAPVHEQNASGRGVYLPEQMLLVRMRSLTDYDTEVVEKGYHYIPAELEEVIFFIRPDHVIPMSKGGACLEDVDYNDLRLLGYVRNEAVYELYEDDGNEKDYDNPEHMTKLVVSKDGTICQEGSAKKLELLP